MNPIRYSAIISTAWNKLWKGGWVLWRFALVYSFGVVVLYGAPLGLFVWAAIRMERYPNVPVLAASGGLLMFGLLAMLLLSVFYQGGMAWLTNEAEEDRLPSVGDGFAAGARAFWRLLGLDAIVWLAASAVAGIFALVVVLLLAGTGLATGGDPAATGVAFFGGMCCLYAVFIVLAVAAAVVIGPIITVAVRAITLEGVGVGGGFSAGWSAIRHRFKNSVVTSLMLLGLTYAFSFVVSLVTQPLYSFMLAGIGLTTTPSGDPTAFLSGAFGLVFIVIIAVSILSSIPGMVFVELGWTAFYRQLTGRDVPPTTYAATYPAEPATYPAEPVPPTGGSYPPMAPPPAPPAPPADEQPPLQPQPPAPTAPPTEGPDE